MMRGPCERCGGGDDTQPLTRQVDGVWDRMVCPGCAELEPPRSGCLRCGRMYMLQVTPINVGGMHVEVRLCLPCRGRAQAENAAAAARQTERTAE